MASSDPVILPAVGNEAEAYSWIKENELIKLKRVCEACNSPLVVGPSEKHAILESFQCHNLRCEQFRERKEILVNDGSFFYPVTSVYALSKYIHLIKYFCDQADQKHAARVLGMDSKTSAKVYKKCRDVCVKIFERNPVQLGGPIIAVAARVYDLNGKAYDGSKLNSVWILVLVCRTAFEEKNNGGHLQIVTESELSDFPTLISIMEKVTVAGSFLACDFFGNPPRASSNHFSFINCEPDHEEILRSYYREQNESICRIRKAPRDAEGYLKEAMWRERVKDDVFKSFLEDFKNNFY